jgi:hypothetical protein
MTPLKKKLWLQSSTILRESSFFYFIFFLLVIFVSNFSNFSKSRLARAGILFILLF